jgi:hypothetical protein
MGRLLLTKMKLDRVPAMNWSDCSSIWLYLPFMIDLATRYNIDGNRASLGVTIWGNYWGQRMGADKRMAAEQAFSRCYLLLLILGAADGSG